MARTRTLTELISDVRVEGAYNRSNVFTDAILTRWINLGIAWVYDLLVQSWEDYYTTTDDSLVTVADQEYVTLPSDFYKLMRLDLQTSSQSWERLLTYGLAEENTYEDVVPYGRYGTVYRYRLQGDRIYLRPIPKTVDSLRIVYIPCATELSLGADTFDGINGFEDLIVQYVLRKCDAREQRPTNERDAEIQRQVNAIRRAADQRNAAEPFLLTDNTI